MKESNDILMSYLRVTQHMSQHFRSHFGRLNLTFPQALVLTVLGEDGPMPISALAERTGSANSTVSGIVDRLEKLELARRERSETDRRVSYVTATAEGQNRCFGLFCHGAQHHGAPGQRDGPHRAGKTGPGPDPVRRLLRPKGDAFFPGM